LHSSEHVTWAKQHAADHGISLGQVEVDLAKFLKRKDEVVAKLTGGVAQLAKARKITVLTGTASFTSANTLRITPPQPTTQNSEPKTVVDVSAKNIVIATGSAPVELP